MDKKNREFHTYRGYQLLKHKNNQLTASMEDYLEMIYRQCRKKGYTRINQLSHLLNVQAPSASRTVQKLAKMGLIDYEKYGHIQLTEKGSQLGEMLFNRHILIERFLSKIGIVETLLRDTEMIEHNISVEALENMKAFNEFLEDNPDILERYKVYRCRHN